MSKVSAIFPTIAGGAIILAVAACSPAASNVAALPEGETDLSCAVLVYAANDLLGDKKITDPDGLIGNNHIYALTRYGTAHARSAGMDANEVLGLIKIQALGMQGIGSSKSKQVSSSEIARRARKCIAP